MSLMIILKDAKKLFQVEASRMRTIYWPGRNIDQRILRDLGFNGNFEEFVFAQNELIIVVLLEFLFVRIHYDSLQQIKLIA